MRLVTYNSAGGARAGVLRDDGVLDAWDALGGGGEGMRELLASGRLSELGQAQGELLPAAEVELLAPVPDPEKIIGIGLNYAEHAKEGRQEPPASPTFFAKFRNALRADGATVKLPAASRKVDYEAEVAFVVGRRAKDVAAADALEYLAGYTLVNDLSARDLQFATPQWMPGKVFDGAAPCGPAIASMASAGSTSVHRRPMTKATSASESTFSLAAGKETVAPAGARALRNLAKKVGSAGGSIPASAACER